MGAALGVQVGNATGSTVPAAGEASRLGSDGFVAALSAAGTGTGRGAETARAVLEQPQLSEPALAAADAGLAAALAALFPALAPALVPTAGSGDAGPAPARAEW